MARKEKTPDMRNGMWERGPVKVDEIQDRAQQARVNIDPDNPRIFVPARWFSQKARQRISKHII
jgi:hypothetical protein